MHSYLNDINAVNHLGSFVSLVDYGGGTYYIQLSYNLLTKGLAIEYLKNVIKEFHHDPLFMLELYEESSI